MNIRILLVNPLLYTLCLIVCLEGKLYGQQQADTIGNEIMLLEKQLGRWQDSIAHVPLPERYKSPELLLEFMCVNASPGAQKVLEWFLPGKDIQKD